MRRFTTSFETLNALRMFRVMTWDIKVLVMVINFVMVDRKWV
ncbi:hypothetical protein Leryth_026657 [Lithospermum erythrorhizon]|nr:hypothetical protein Leryth_026657 [Lithospermum erythrorhizon]